MLLVNASVVGRDVVLGIVALPPIAAEHSTGPASSCRSPREVSDGVEQRRLLEHVVVVCAPETEKALGLGGCGEQRFAQRIRHHLVRIAMRDQDRDVDVADATERIEGTASSSPATP